MGHPDAFDCTETRRGLCRRGHVRLSAFGVATVGQDRGDQPVARRFLDAAMIIGGDAQPGPGLHECFVPLTRRQQCATQLPVGTGELDRNEASLCERDHGTQVGQGRLDLTGQQGKGGSDNQHVHFDSGHVGGRLREALAQANQTRRRPVHVPFGEGGVDVGQTLG